MNKPLVRILTLAALALLGVTMACAGDNTPDSLPAVAAQRPTIGPNKTPPGPSVHQVEQTTTLSGSDPGPVSASCPQGEVALGGGWSVHWSVSGINARVFAAVLTGNTWSVRFAHPGLSNTSAAAQTGATGIEAGIAVTAYVECLRGANGAAVTQRSFTQNLPPTPATESNDHLGGTVAVCNQGETLVGFGFDFGSASTNLELEAVWPRDDVPPVPEAVMVFTVRNHDTVSHTFPTVVQCLSSVSVSASYPFQQIGDNFAPGANATIVTPCPNGAALAGGGLRYTRHDSGDQYLGNLFDLEADRGGRGWQGGVVVVSDFGTNQVSLVVSAICLSFTS